MNKKKVYLVRPYFESKHNQITYPIGLAYLGAVLRDKGYVVRVYDLPILKIKNDDFVKILCKKKFDYIGITALTFYYYSMVDLCKKIRNEPLIKDKIIILGGVHVSQMPEFSYNDTNADYIVIGEGEITLANLLEKLDLNLPVEKIKGIAYKTNNEFKKNADQDLIENIDDLPFPAWDLLYPNVYPNTPHGLHYKKAPIFPILTSRGCPFACIYCASKNFWQQRIRFHSPKRIVDEIEILHRDFGAKEIHIWDDNFTLKRNRIFDFCREINKRKINLLFACPNGVRVDTLDERILKYMRSVGFYCLIFAIETGSQSLQYKIKKNLDLKIVPKIIENAHKLGFINRSFFMIYLPFETNNDVHKTINFAKNLKLDQANIFIFTPIPGSSFFYKWFKNKNFNPKNWNFGFYSNPQDMKGFNSINPKNILKFQILFYVKFFIFKPIKLIKFFLRIKPSTYIFYINYFLQSLMLNTG